MFGLQVVQFWESSVFMNYVMDAGCRGLSIVNVETNFLGFKDAVLLMSF